LVLLLIFEIKTKYLRSGMKHANSNIGIVTFPVSKAGVIPLNNLIKIVEVFSSHVYMITGDEGYQNVVNENNIHKYIIRHSKPNSNILSRSINFFITQLRISKFIINHNQPNIWLFFLGGDDLVIPILAAKLLRKKVLIVSSGSPKKVAQSKNDKLAFILGLLEKISYRLVDKIIIYSERLIEEYELQHYTHKIRIACHHFLDFSKFKVEKQLSYRNNVVGYIGRLGEEKGILKFLEAIPMVLKRQENVSFVIIGDGELREKVRLFVDKDENREFVELYGWVEHDNLSKYLNMLKLVVLPSYTEGLPGVILEAMACGTPVLATPVGAIPDLIKDGETGFIMENNSPESIAENIARALDHPDLDTITANGRTFVMSNFTFAKAVNDYRTIVKEVLQLGAK
jgi:glycosyltransferase involved in cell wall biosynthesis